METTVKPLPAREMHKIVWVKIGVFSLFVVTFPMAMVRVSQMEKFQGFHVKSLTVDMKKPSGESPDVVPVASPASGPASTSSSTEKVDQDVNPASQTAEISNLVELEALTRKLYDQLDRSWQTSPRFEHNLVYRVSVSADGAIAGYEPLNQPARDYVGEIPLPSLHGSQETGASSPPETLIRQFTVVFSPSGVLEVSP